jgi:hypothetical protein
MPESSTYYSTMDALSCFTYVTKNLPIWISDVDNLNDYTTKKQKEFAAEFSKLAKVQPARSKHSSLKSVRISSDNPLLNSNSDPATDPNTLQYTPLDLATKQIFATARRKRKVTNSVHSGTSGPPKLRTRHMVVIWYDSVVQEGFESLVRNIAGARNNLRKAKMSAAMKNGFQLPPLRTAANIGQNIMSTRGDPKNVVRPKVSIPVGKPTALPLPSATPLDNVFDKTDKELELAQNLCEVAAHQFLRDGDCQLELEGIKKKFETALAIGKLECERLEGEKMNEDGDEVEDIIEEDESFLTRITTNVSIPKALQPITTDPAAIEVDDNSDAESVEIDLTAFRASRMGPRARA